MEINTFLEHKEENTPNVKLVKDLCKAMNGGDKTASGNQTRQIFAHMENHIG